MTDKDKQIILAEIERRMENAAQYSISAYNGMKEIRDYINSLPEEPVSRCLEEASKEYATNLIGYDEENNQAITELNDIEYYAFKAGAKWQKEKILSIIDDSWITNTANEGNSPSGKSYGERASEDEEIIKKIKEE